MKATHKKLFGFIGLSLLLHAMWFMLHSEYRINIPEQDSKPMAVHIKEQLANSPSKSRPISKNEIKPSNNQSRHSETNNATDTDTHNPLSTAQVLTKIKQKLTHEFVYPAVARRMGWQGRVLLGFQVDASGNIHQVHIKQSSGYALLDDSAVSALSRIGSITIQKVGSFIGALQLEIPVIYRLEG